MITKIHEMKILPIICLSIFYVSCTKESCNYTLENTGDSSLFISYSINNVNYKYYQKFDPSTFASESGLILKNQKVLNSYYPIQFDNLGWNGSRYIYNSHEYHPYVELLINDTIMIDDTSIPVIPIPPLSKVLLESYKFITPKALRDPASLSSYDPIFFPSVSITIRIDDIEYSTDILVNHFNFSKDSLNKYLWNISKFKTVSRENVCHDLKLITGEFNTRVMAGGVPTLYEIKNGHFRIVIE